MSKGLPPEVANVSTVRGFLLLGSSEGREPRPVQAAPFLPVYPAAPTGNLLVVAVTALDRRLRAPVYFFLGHLSVADLCYISVTVPKSILVSLTQGHSISSLGCGTQVCLVILFASSEYFVLTATSYDRYAAIRLPLRYEVVTDREACGKTAAASWLGGGADGSRARIFGAVLRMPAAEGRAGAFSTCLPRLAVVAVFFRTAAIAHLKPVSDSPSTLDPPVSVFYVVVPPALNPLIYGLRNRDVKAALGLLLGEISSILKRKCPCPPSD
ncbi:olfactory receptor 14J1-like [Ornithorhynchus anatinus]|uniref:olfactory receptor 14J1-like n=1 Tax=Ornithorhynchus anatinus TaxID=9258 RepID=UPI000454B71D|nr:olfactory receptor 14J1-like [Ornithorhynchus anatinus]